VVLSGRHDQVFIRGDAGDIERELARDLATQPHLTQVDGDRRQYPKGRLTMSITEVYA
jgi:hypothetical protein